MNGQVNNEQNAANPQNTQNVTKSLHFYPIKKEIPKIKQGGCGCVKRRQL